MGVNNDDKKEAVNIGVTLSSQLIAASLSMLAIIAALFVFIVDKRDVSFFFYLLIILSFISFISSVFLGGKGIDTARKKGFDGSWELKCSKDKFNFQAILCLLGVLFFVFSIFCSKAKPDDALLYLKKIDSIILQKNRHEILLEKENDSLKLEINKINNKLDKLYKMIKK
jgi:hypothetical protein